jgi:proton glutamate symport protein
VKSRTRSLLIGAAVALSIAFLLTYLSVEGVIAISTLNLAIIRWIAIAVLFAYGLSRRTITAWIVVAMFVGGEFGHDFPARAESLQVLSKIFLNLIKCIIAPLILSTLVVGIAGHSDIKQIGRMGIKALIYFEVVTTLALFIGLAAINLTQAGAGVGALQGSVSTTTATAPAKQGWQDVVLHAFPENLAKAWAEGQVLQIVVFAVIFGIALALLSDAKRAPMLTFMESLSETMFKFTNIVMLFAPFGVAGAMAYTVGKMGLGVLVPLFKLLATLYLALIAFLLFVLLPVALIARVPLRDFLKAVAEPASIAFATASSEAALPRAMESMTALGVSRHVVAFVMPTGYSFNLDGSTLYLALSSMFVAQAAGIHMSFAHQLLMVFTLMLTSKGVAGVPRATLVILLGTAASFDLPTWPIFLILGIDQLMDMARTSVNVIGNCLATLVVAKWENEFRREPVSEVVLDAVEN